MRSDEVGMGIDEVQRMLEFPSVLREPQRLAREPTEFLTQGEIIAFNIGRVDLSLAM